MPMSLLKGVAQWAIPTKATHEKPVFFFFKKKLNYLKYGSVFQVSSDFLLKKDKLGLHAKGIKSCYIY